MALEVNGITAHLLLIIGVKGREFPVIFHRQVFTNKDDSTGTLYRISNDLSATAAPLKSATA
jgi:hypothetical protein